MESLTKSMKTLTENLALVQKEKCSAEFLITLDELIEKAVIIQNHANESPSKKRRLTDTSSSSDEVRCISTEIETIIVDSDSDVAEVSDDNSNELNASSTNQSTVNVNSEKPPTQGLHINELYGKRAVVKLKRIDVTAYGLSAIHGLDRNVASPSDGGISEKNDMPSRTSGQVSMIENEIISDANLKPIRHYTHENNRKTYRDVCLLQ